MSTLIQFLSSEDGAVTIDWVVLCAGVVVLGVAVASSMETAVDGESAKLGSRISTQIAAMP